MDIAGVWEKLMNTEPNTNKMILLKERLFLHLLFVVVVCRQNITSSFHLPIAT